MIGPFSAVGVSGGGRTSWKDSRFFPGDLARTAPSVVETEGRPGVASEGVAKGVTEGVVDSSGTSVGCSPPLDSSSWLPVCRVLLVVSQSSLAVRIASIQSIFSLTSAAQTQALVRCLHEAWEDTCTYAQQPRSSCQGTVSQNMRRHY